MSPFGAEEGVAEWNLVGKNVGWVAVDGGNFALPNSAAGDFAATRPADEGVVAEVDVAGKGSAGAKMVVELGIVGYRFPEPGFAQVPVPQKSSERNRRIVYGTCAVHPISA